MYTQDTIAVNVSSLSSFFLFLDWANRETDVDAVYSQEGDKITGVFSCKANARNPRDLDLGIEYEVKGQHPSKDSLQYKM